MSDETKASVLAFCWVAAFTIGMIVGDSRGLKIVLLSTAIFATVVYMDMLREHSKEERRIRRRRNAVERQFCREMARLERSDNYDNR